jgi:predicted transcriptional regulator
MTALELKNNLHRMVVETEDLEILEQINLLFEALRAEKTIGEAERLQILQGLEDLRAGRTKSDEEVRKKIRAILKRA